MLIHTVRSGDTLFRLARQYNTTAFAIAQANGLENPDRLVVGQSLIIPTGRPPAKWGEIAVGGYAYPNLRPAVVADAMRHLTFINVFADSVGPDGSLSPPMNDQRIIADARQARVQPRLVIANLNDEGFQPEGVRRFLADPQAQDKLLASVIARMKSRGYEGLDVDFEYVPAASKDAYNCFLAKARAWLQGEGFNLSTAVPAKTSDNQSGLLFEGIDYAAHGRYADFVLLMTYEWGYQTGPAGPVAPINEVRKVLDYAVTRIPKNKILMGIPNYGYDWTLPFAPGSRARVVGNAEAVNIAVARGAEINFNETAKTPWFRYTDDGGRLHEVWFEDARSIYAKLELVREFGIGGIGYWTVNYAFPQNWWLVEALWKVRKW